MLEPYFRRSKRVSVVSAREEAPLILFYCCDGEVSQVLGAEPVVQTEHWERNGALLLEKLKHLEETKGDELLRWLSKYEHTPQSLCRVFAVKLS